MLDNKLVESTKQMTRKIDESNPTKAFESAIHNSGVWLQALQAIMIMKTIKNIVEERQKEDLREAIEMQGDDNKLWLN